MKTCTAKSLEGTQCKVTQSHLNISIILTIVCPIQLSVELCYIDSTSVLLNRGVMDFYISDVFNCMPLVYGKHGSTWSMVLPAVFDHPLYWVWVPYCQWFLHSYSTCLHSYLLLPYLAALIVKTDGSYSYAWHFFKNCFMFAL